MKRLLAFAVLACAACSATTDEYPRIVLKNASGYSSVRLYMIRITSEVPKVLPGGEFDVTCPCDGATVDLVVSGNRQGVILALGYDDAGHVIARAIAGARQLPGAFDVALGGLTCYDGDQDGFCANESGAWHDPKDDDANVSPLEWQ